jgi:23S rRNA (uridine2552-2'-O)-methyltransferase
VSDIDMSKKSRKQNNSWHSKQNSDIYVKKSRAQGYRSRASYKLLEINQKDHILKSNMAVVDLGAAPGGWSQVAKELVGDAGSVIALDILDMEPIPDVSFIQGDFTTDATLAKLLDYLKANNLTKIDVVISDMAPNLTGIKTADQANSIYLVQLAYEFAKMVLKPGGTILAKAFQGANFNGLVKKIAADFDKLLIRKPNASRSESKEVYLLATGYNL